jgi:hypothetical protein
LRMPGLDRHQDVRRRSHMVPFETEPPRESSVITRLAEPRLP